MATGCARCCVVGLYFATLRAETLRMGLGSTGKARLQTRRARGALAATVVAVVVLAMAVPALADEAAPAPSQDLPANAWIVAKDADGHVQVVTGQAASDLVDDAAAGRP